MRSRKSSSSSSSLHGRKSLGLPRIVRFSVTDSYATDSSSSGDDDDNKVRSSNSNNTRRYITEIIIPPAPPTPPPPSTAAAAEVPPVTSNGNGRTLKRRKATKYIGVRQRPWGRWCAEIRDKNRNVRLWLGTFDSPEAAASAYDREAIRLRGPNAVTNFNYAPQVPPPPPHQVADTQENFAKEIETVTETGVRSEISSTNGPLHRMDKPSLLNACSTQSSKMPLDVTCSPKLPPVAASNPELLPDVTYAPKTPQVATYTRKPTTPKMVPLGTLYDSGQTTGGEEAGTKRRTPSSTAVDVMCSSAEILNKERRRRKKKKSSTVKPSPVDVISNSTEISKKERRRRKNKKSSIVNPNPVVDDDCGKKYHGVGQRLCGKRDAEIQQPIRNVKFRLGTCDTAREARGPNAIPCFGTQLESEALVAERPPEGYNRAVLESYRDCHSQARECGWQQGDWGELKTDLWSDITILPESVYPNGPCLRIGEVTTSATESSKNVVCFPKLPPVAASISELPPDVTCSVKTAQVATYSAKISPVAVSPKMQPASNYNSGQATCSQEKLLNEASEYICGSLPSSFTAQLPICSSEVQKGQKLLIRRKPENLAEEIETVALSSDGPLYRMDKLSLLSTRSTESSKMPLGVTCSPKLPPVAACTSELPPNVTNAPKVPRDATYTRRHITPKMMSLALHYSSGQTTCCQERETKRRTPASTAADGISSSTKLLKKERRGRKKKKSSNVNPNPVNGGCVKKYHGVRQRSSGKWAAEILHPRQSAKLLLGTFDTAEEASMFYACFGTKLESEALVAKHPLKGNNRAVLESYRDWYSQDCLGDSKEIGMDSKIDLWSDISILPEFVYPDGPCFRIDEVTTATESSKHVTCFPTLPPVAASISELPPDVTCSVKTAQVATYSAKISPVAVTPKMQPASDYNFGQATCSQEKLLSEVSEYICGSLPSSFTAQFPICSSEVQKGQKLSVRRKSRCCLKQR